MQEIHHACSDRSENAWLKGNKPVSGDFLRKFFITSLFAPICCCFLSETVFTLCRSTIMRQTAFIQVAFNKIVCQDSAEDERHVVVSPREVTFSK